MRFWKTRISATTGSVMLMARLVQRFYVRGLTAG